MEKVILVGPPRRPLQKSARDRRDRATVPCHPPCPSPSFPPLPREGATYPSPQDLVDGRAFFQRALGHDLCPHFLHIQHECVKRFLYVGLLLFFFLFGVLMLSGYRQNRHKPINNCEVPLPPQQRTQLPGCSTPKPRRSEQEVRFHFGSFPPWKAEQKHPREGVGEEKDFKITSSGVPDTPFSQARAKSTVWLVPPRPVALVLAGQTSNRSVGG